MKLRQIGRWFFPSNDTVCAQAAIEQFGLIATDWLKHIPRRRVAVQAGGNCGIFPLKLAEYFDAVYTAEPDHENFICLALNCPAPNVYAMRAAFGHKAGTTGLHLTENNAGGHYMEGAGTVPVLPIDALELPACDLIALDIEGGEFEALQGAETTIRECAPTLVIEDKGHVTRFGQTQAQMHDWLLTRGYRDVGFSFRDRIWVPR